jgi:hypothetical protein
MFLVYLHGRLHFIGDMTMLKTQQILRGTYGELIFAGNNPLIDAGRQLLKEAIAKEYLKAPFVAVDKKHRGSALNYDLYDVDRNEVLVQRRYTVCTKYGNSPTKDYFVIRRHRNSIQVLLVSDDAKRLVVKRSRTAKVLGEVLEVLHRNDEVFSTPSKCLMVVEVLGKDRLQSLEFQLPLLRTRDSATFRNGKTWFQLFCTRDRLDHAIRDEKQYQDAIRDGKRLAIIEVVPKGRVFRQTDPLRFLVSSVRFIRQIELIQPATPVTGEVEA